MKVQIIPVAQPKFWLECEKCGRWQGGKTRPTECANPRCLAPLEKT